MVLHAITIFPYLSQMLWKMATALWYACMYGRYAHVKILVDAGCDINIPDLRLMTPLIVAVSRVC